MLKNILDNPIMLTDVYNLSHERLKVNTDWEVSHIYNRSAGMILYGFAETVNRVLSIRITMDMVDEAESHAKKMGIIFPRELFERVVKEQHGYFPIAVESLPEGTWCPIGTPFAQVRNTVEGFGELVTWLEGIFLHASFPCAVATEAFHMRRYLEELKKDRGYDDSFLLRLHSFGFRGHRSLEDAYWAGTAWNMFLFGTDDFHTMQHAPTANVTSISALAHKVTQQYDNEYEGYLHTIDATASAGEKIISIVIDTYDANRFIDEMLVPLSTYAKEKGVHIVIRPDSGDVLQQMVDIYHKTVAYEITNVTVIIGESMSFANVLRYDRILKLKQIPFNFVNYGIGGGFYNHINRDTLGFAMKTAFSNGKPRMKFGMDEIKRSIPDKVTLIYGADNNLVAEREDVVSEKFLELAYMYDEYMPVYIHDEEDKVPYTYIPKWEDTKDIASNYIHMEELQERIKLSDSIKELVKEFEKQYA